MNPVLRAIRAEEVRREQAEALALFEKWRSAPVEIHLTPFSTRERSASWTLEFDEGGRLYEKISYFDGRRN